MQKFFISLEGAFRFAGHPRYFVYSSNFNFNEQTNKHRLEESDGKKTSMRLSWQSW